MNAKKLTVCSWSTALLVGLLVAGSGCSATGSGDETQPSAPGLVEEAKTPPPTLDDRARVAIVKSSFRAIHTACDMFRLHNDRWPDSLDELVNPPERPNGGRSQKYLQETPKDPWTQEAYVYEVDDAGPLLISYGADQSEGGEGVNADIRSRGSGF